MQSLPGSSVRPPASLTPGPPCALSSRSHSAPSESSPPVRCFLLFLFLLLLLPTKKSWYPNSVRQSREWMKKRRGKIRERCDAEVLSKVGKSKVKQDQALSPCVCVRSTAGRALRCQVPEFRRTGEREAELRQASQREGDRRCTECTFKIRLSSPGSR